MHRAAEIRNGSALRRLRARKDFASLCVMAAGALAVAYYFLGLHAEWKHDLLETIINLASATVIFVGIRINKPANRTAWYFIAAGFLMFGLGNIPSTSYAWAGAKTQPFPDIADVGYLLTEPLICVGLVLFMRDRKGRWRYGNVIDAAILTTAIGFPIFSFLVIPHFAAPAPLFSRVVSGLYPLEDTLLIATGIAFVVGRGRRSISYRLLFASFLCLLASDLVFSEAILAGWFTSGSILTIGWPLFSILGAAAVLHPSVVEIGVPDDEQRELTGVRVVILAAAALSPAIIDAFEPNRGTVNSVARLVVMMVVFALIAMRLLGFTREGSRQRRELSGVLGRLQTVEHERLRLLRRTVQAGEAERNRVAVELHDGPIQRLTAACVRLEILGMEIDEGRLPQAREALGKAQAAIWESGAWLRNLMSNLRPPVLDEQGIASAVEHALIEFEVESGIPARFTTSVEHPIPKDHQTVIYRVLQEALQNVRKHAEATKVGVTFAPRDGATFFEVRDNGKGFEVRGRSEATDKHIGLLAMRERVEMARGTFHVESSPEGTAISLELPMSDEDDPASRELAETGVRA
jgi:signal transduction histidine kinase